MKYCDRLSQLLKRPSIKLEIRVGIIRVINVIKISMMTFNKQSNRYDNLVPSEDITEIPYNMKSKTSIAVGSKSSSHLMNWSNQYKASCIDFYLKHFKCQLIGSEFRYGTAQLITDLVITTPINTISIEIKTEHDDLRRILRQTTEASKVFNLVIVFVSAKHKQEVLKLLPEHIGITIFSENGCKIVRPPHRQSSRPEEAIASIPASFLRLYFNISEDLDSDKLRQFIIAHRKTEVNSCFRSYLLEKYENNYMQFLHDRGKYTHIEDIPTLNMKSTVEIK